MFHRIVRTLVSLAATGALYAGPAAFVSVNGSDANFCTSASPCRTFAQALNQVDNFGTITALDKGDFTLGSTLNVNVGVTIDGGPGATLTGPLGGSVISLHPGPGAVIVLRNLDIIVSSDSGIGVSGAVGTTIVRLEHLHFDMSGASPGNGIILGVVFGSVFLNDVTVDMGSFAQQEGIVLVPTLATTSPYKVFVDRVTVRGGDNGLIVQDGSVILHDSSFENCNIGINFQAINTSPVRLLEGAHISKNTTGISTGPGTLYLSGSVLSGNTTALFAYAGATAITFRNNVFANNGVDGTPALSTSLK